MLYQQLVMTCCKLGEENMVDSLIDILEYNAYSLHYYTAVQDAMLPPLKTDYDGLLALERAPSQIPLIKERQRVLTEQAVALPHSIKIILLKKLTENREPDMALFLYALLATIDTQKISSEENDILQNLYQTTSFAEIKLILEKRYHIKK